MWLRRAFFGWLIPAAFLLPLWLLIGWGLFDTSGWGFVWLIVAMPAVFIGQLGLTLLARVRGSVRARRALSWWDVAGFALWHSLIVSLGFFVEAWWAPVFALTIAVGLALLWMQLWQLWRETRDSVTAATATAQLQYDRVADRARQYRETIVLSEGGGPQTGHPHPGNGR